MIIFQVRNKSFGLLFESRADAQAYMNENCTATNGLTLTEVHVIGNTKGKEGEEN